MSAGPVVDLQQLGGDFTRDPYPVYAELRAAGPVHRVLDTDGEEVWFVVGYDACRTAFTDPRLSRDWRKSGNIGQIVNTEQDQPALAHMLMSDPPDHTRLRRLVAREFTPRRIEALAPGSSRSPTNCWTRCSRGRNGRRTWWPPSPFHCP